MRHTKPVRKENNLFLPTFTHTHTMEITQKIFRQPIFVPYTLRCFGIANIYSVLHSRVDNSLYSTANSISQGVHLRTSLSYMEYTNIPYFRIFSPRFILAIRGIRSQKPSWGRLFCVFVCVCVCANLCEESKYGGKRFFSVQFKILKFT